MSTRERWLLAGLILLAALLPALGLWQQARYNRAERAVQEFVQLEERAERNAKNPLLRQARPEVRVSLSKGDFAAALQRLTLLQREESAPAAAKAGQAVGVDALWPPNSPARAKVRTILRELARKQGAGYDVAPAREALLRVAEAARSGRKTQALAAFGQVETLLRDAALRPGFVAAPAPGTAAARARRGDFRRGAPNSAAPPGSSAPGSGAPVPEAQIQQLVQFFQVLPQIIEQAPPAQRPFLRQLQPLGDEMALAYRQGKDLRAVVPLMQQLGAALRGGDEGKARRLLEQTRAALQAAQAAPAHRASSAPPPGLRRFAGRRFPGRRFPSLPPGGMPRGDQRRVAPSFDARRMPAMPPASPNLAASPQLAPEDLLRTLDEIRKLPEPVYRQQRPQIAFFISQALAGMSRAPGKSSPQVEPRGKPDSVGPQGKKPRLEGNDAARDAGVSSVGDAALRLQVSRNGQIVGMKAAGRDLAGGAAPGGIFVAREGGETRLRGVVQREGSTLRADLHGGENNFVAIFQPAGQGVSIDLQARRDPSGRAEMLLRLPLRAPGWLWKAGGKTRTITDGDTYSARPDGAAAPIVLRGAGLQLEVVAASASSIAFNPASGVLELRFALKGERSIIRHTVRLLATTGSI